MKEVAITWQLQLSSKEDLTFNVSKCGFSYLDIRGLCYVKPISAEREKWKVLYTLFSIHIYINNFHRARLIAVYIST
jgi:hypothetical protein